jgi:hypothetical protein
VLALPLAAVIAYGGVLVTCWMVMLSELEDRKVAANTGTAKPTHFTHTEAAS